MPASSSSLPSTAFADERARTGDEAAARLRTPELTRSAQRAVRAREVGLPRMQRDQLVAADALAQVHHARAAVCVDRGEGRVALGFVDDTRHQAELVRAGLRRPHGFRRRCGRNWTHVPRRVRRHQHTGTRRACIRCFWVRGFCPARTHSRGQLLDQCACRGRELQHDVRERDRAERAEERDTSASGSRLVSTFGKVWPCGGNARDNRTACDLEFLRCSR